MVTRTLLVAAAAVSLLAPTVVGALGLFPGVGVLELGLGWAAFCVVAAVLVAIGRGRRRGDDADDADDEGGAVWEAIPSWQYDGRHVESGGLARGEQEAALAEVEEQASKRERERF
ncbi:hypothetical protein [Salinigranum sp. GCM10025319]|uniref:hypothetical protein n=1 Tax=Salinigranum sp. GCM10025319 TaxID=3252687 RepID=UPI00360A12B9